jgi:glycosyltransferase involved in cell wall biosynthesis
VSRVLWIVQDGVLSGPGASQVVPYLIGLSRLDHELALLSFEHRRFLEDEARVARVREQLRVAGVRWEGLPFGEGPAVFRTLSQMRRARRAARRFEFDLVHARSYVPALIAARMRRPFLFDMRGLWPQEKVDAGLWPAGGWLHRTWQRKERQLLDRAAGVVLLAHGAKEYLPTFDKPVEVIPTAVDLERFRPDLPPPPGGEHLAGKRVLAIAGALGSWYLLPEMAAFCGRALARGDADHVLVLSEEDRRPAVRLLVENGVPRAAITDLGVPFDEVPNWFSLASVGILFIESAPSKRASAPTKLAEFLACGVPVVTTPGIGDTEEFLTRTGTGVIVRAHDAEGHEAALDALAQVREGAAWRCREAAVHELSITDACEKYVRLYDRIMERIT